MHIASLKGTNIELTDAIKQYVEKKLDAVSKLTEGFEPAAEIRIEVGKTSNHHNKGPFFKAEYTLNLPGSILRAEEKLEDLYQAVDKATDELRRQVKEYKDKLRERKIAPRPDKA